MKITFCGAAREVTGSCYVVEADGVRFLVDCGMLQGGPDARARNHRAFPFEPTSIDFVLLTHAHIDHSGLLPKLTREGFAGPIYATQATQDLLAVMLPDSARIQEGGDSQASIGKRQEAGDGPLYTTVDADLCLAQIRATLYDTAMSPHPAIACRFRNAGHILGSAILEVWVTEKQQQRKLVFSGDLGQPGRPILHDAAPIDDADILIVESTYANRQHRDLATTLEELALAIERTMARRGNVIIPAFAVGRSQEIIYYLHQQSRAGRLHDLKIYVDSPMAIRATEITRRHLELFDAEARALVAWHESARNLPVLSFVRSAKESSAIGRSRAGAIIIAASGMCEAGRVRHHLRRNLGRRESSVVFVGFQAAGTLGRQLVDGAESVRLFDQDIPVRADIYTLGGLSAHADRTALLQWLGHFRRPPQRTFIVHGEEAASTALARVLAADWGWAAEVPGFRESVFVEPTMRPDQSFAPTPARSTTP